MLGFEYGYSVAVPDGLVLWEAQFGDFVNNAQVIVDQFMVSGFAKWEQTSRLTLLLPHGYEGNGPEHSSARVERFLQLAAQGNVRIANCSTPAQYFHLLRLQAHGSTPRPLVIFTPKSLLRLKQAASRLDELTSGSFRPVFDDPNISEEERAEVRRLLLCSGKVYYDIVGHPAYADTREDRGRTARSALSLPGPRLRRAAAGLSGSRRGRLGPGGASEHGAFPLDPAPPRGVASRRRQARLRRPAVARLSERGLPDGPRRRAESARARSARRQPVGSYPQDFPQVEPDRPNPCGQPGASRLQPVENRPAPLPCTGACVTVPSLVGASGGGESGVISAVVTGAAKGLGREIAARLVEDGVHVVATDIDSAALDRTSAELGALVEPLVADSGDWEAHVLAADAAERSAPLRYWVNNAGIDIQGGAHEVTAEEIERGYGCSSSGPCTAARSQSGGCCPPGPDRSSTSPRSRARTPFPATSSTRRRRPR